MGLLQEFKEFAVKGNALDMAVGIIIGASFNSIVQSLVNDVFMPPLGMAIGKVDFKELKLVLQAADATVTPPVAEVAVRYGMFINTVINFLIVAFVVFIMVKFLNTLVKKRDAAK